MTIYQGDKPNVFAMTGADVPAFLEAVMPKPIDIEWILTSPLLVTRRSDLEVYIVELTDNGDITGRAVTITWSPDGRMLFDGQDIETEDFMGYVSLMDEIADGQDVGAYWAQIEGGVE